MSTESPSTQIPGSRGSTDMKKFERLSKKLSFLLRHHPEKWGITLTPDGWADVDLIARRLRIRAIDIEELVRQQTKQRFELKDGRIRALYGHTIDVEPVSRHTEPPAYLFHGTARETVETILKDGLLPMERRRVHLSESSEEAFAVGLRRDPNPTILRVRAREASRSGILFWKSGEVWLCERIPPGFIEIAYGETKPSGRGMEEKDE